MRSRLPGKLRSSPELSDVVIVKDRARLAKRRFVIDGLTTQILPQTNQAPRQHQRNAYKQEQVEHDSHTSPLPDFP